MTAVALPAIHAPYAGGDAAQTLQDVRTLVEHAITNQPRPLQKRIGPSELGAECSHCLAARLTVTGPHGLPQRIEAAVGPAQITTEGAAA